MCASTVARREPRILNTALQVQRRADAAALARPATIWDFGCAAGASPVQLRAFDRAVGDLHEAIGVANHAIYGDPAPPGAVQRQAAADAAAPAQDDAAHASEDAEAGAAPAQDDAEREGEDAEAGDAGLETEDATEADAEAAEAPAGDLGSTEPGAATGEAASDDGGLVDPVDADALAAVQRRGGDREDPRAVQAAAARGLRGSGGAVPHLGPVQRAFGGHDVSGVRAVVGGAGAEACDAMGAEAYASGDAVVFRGAPSLHTVAHELTHVVQQRRGVALKGGVGEVGDRYEREADAVAARVVRGEDVSATLDGIAGGGRAAPPAQRVQRKAAAPTKAQLEAKVQQAVKLAEGWLGRKLAYPEKQLVAREVFGHPTAAPGVAAKTVCAKLKQQKKAAAPARGRAPARTPAARAPAARTPPAKRPAAKSATDLKAKVAQAVALAEQWLRTKLTYPETQLVAREVYGHPTAKPGEAANRALPRIRAGRKGKPQPSSAKPGGNAERSREVSARLGPFFVSRKDKIVKGQRGTEYEAKGQVGATVFAAPLAPGVTFKVDIEAAGGGKLDVAPGQKADLTFVGSAKATPHVLAGIEGVLGVIVGGELAVEAVFRWRGLRSPPIGIDNVVVKGRPFVKAFFDLTGQIKAQQHRGSSLGPEAKAWLQENSNPFASGGVVWEWSPTGDIELARYQGGRWTFPVAAQMAGFMRSLQGVKNKHQPLVDANQKKSAFVAQWRKSHPNAPFPKNFWYSFSQWYADPDFRAAWRASGGG